MILIKIYTLAIRYAAACFYGIRKYENAVILIPVAILPYLFLLFTFYDPLSYYSIFQFLFLVPGRSSSQYA
jgi:hypothetical protein